MSPLLCLQLYLEENSVLQLYMLHTRVSFLPVHGDFLRNLRALRTLPPVLLGHFEGFYVEPRQEMVTLIKDLATFSKCIS